MGRGQCLEILDWGSKRCVLAGHDGCSFCLQRGGRPSVFVVPLVLGSPLRLFCFVLFCFACFVCFVVKLSWQNGRRSIPARQTTKKQSEVLRNTKYNTEQCWREGRERRKRVKTGQDGECQLRCGGSIEVDSPAQKLCKSGSTFDRSRIKEQRGDKRRQRNKGGTHRRNTSCSRDGRILLAKGAGARQG